MQKTFVFFFTIVSGLVSVTSAYAQSVKGRIINEKSEPVPFVVIYDETTSTGVTSNAEGYYEIKLEPGKHTIVYKSMGYYLVRKSIVMDNNPLSVNIVLKEQPVEVKAVVITPGKEDPAYAILRKVISKAPYHLNQVSEYEAEVYLRGTMNIVKIPRIIAKHATVSANGK
ncbi:MAG: carboxypeptidase-like regulatory domain-containing protein, partial [Bacteroidales bacterium]|nr:carboxypeptidase-like regulatory domain-containing protein [Bacteroidales bacterium]